MSCAGKECSDLKIEIIMYNWGACLMIGRSKERMKVLWSAPPKDIFKFNVDEAAIGYRGQLVLGECSEIIK